MSMKRFLVLLVPLMFWLSDPADNAHAQDKQNPDWQGKVDYWQPDWMLRELWGPGRMPKGMQVRMLRHWTYVNFGVPPEYQNARSTVARDAKTIQEGASLYKEHCTSCHGANGMGNGEGAKSLLPSPALLAYMIKRPISADEYLLWAVAEGGKQFQTDMPPFKDKLARDDIWKIISFMRAGFGKSKQN